jgi:hypothetical protein
MAQPIMNDLPRQSFSAAWERLPDLSIPISWSSDCNTGISGTDPQLDFAHQRMAAQL